MNELSSSVLGVYKVKLKVRKVNRESLFQISRFSSIQFMCVRYCMNTVSHTVSCIIQSFEHQNAATLELHLRQIYFKTIHHETMSRSITTISITIIIYIFIIFLYFVYLLKYSYLFIYMQSSNNIMCVWN